MATRHYVEKFESWQNPSTSTDNQWLEFDLSVFDIPASAVVEIAIGNRNAALELFGGVRATSGSLERKLQIVKSFDGDSFVTMHVQTDASGKIDYFSQVAGDIDFHVLGYWLGCDYQEQFQTFSPASSGVWEGHALASSGVSPGQITEFAISNTNVTTQRDVGVRASGSSVSRLFDVSDAAGNGNNCVSKFVLASGANAAIEVYAENNADCNVFFLGHFSTPPGEYVESDVAFPEPPVEAAWNALDIGASGIPNNAICEFILGQDYTASQMIGVRTTSSSFNRLLDLEESQDNLGLSWTKMQVTADTSGFIQYYAQDTTPPDPIYILSSYWKNLTNASNPFPQVARMDLFIRGLNPNVHYIEDKGLTGALLNVSSVDTWETHSLLPFNVPTPTDASPIVAEIGITNANTTVSYSGGVRSTISSDERMFALHDAEGNGLDALSLLVPVDNNGDIQILAGHISFVDFFVIGYWQGATYVDEYSTFQSASGNAWVNHDFGSSYADKVVEVVVTNKNAVQQSGGIRTAGSSIDRRHTISKAETGQDHVTMHVNASGSNGSVELYSSSVSDTTFTLVGKWSSPPGTYNETFTDIGTASSTSTWEAIDAGVPSGSIAEIVSENRYNFTERNLGIRSVGSTQNDRTWILRETDLASTDLAADMFRSFVNVTSGTHVEVFTNSTTTAHVFRLIGYWNSLNTIPVANELPLFVFSSPPLVTGSVPFVTLGSTNSQAAVVGSEISMDWLFRTQDYSPQIIGTFATIASGVNIRLWNVTDGSGILVPIVNSGCYSIGNTGRWGWSTVYIPSSEGNAKHYFYEMISNTSETFDGQFILDVPQGAKWIYPNDQNDYIKSV